MCEDVKGRERIKNCSGLEKTRKKKKGWGGVGALLEIILSQKGKKKTLLGQLGKYDWSSWTGWCGWEVFNGVM